MLFENQTIKALLCTSFSQISVTVSCYTFRELKIRTITPNNVQNQTKGGLKLLGHNGNHQEGIETQKIIALHCWGFNLKFPKCFYCE